MINNEPVGLKPNLSANSDKKEDIPAISDVTDKAIDPSKDVNNEVPNQELSSHVSDHSQSDSVISGAEEGFSEIEEHSNEDGALLRNAKNVDEKPRNDVKEEVSNDQAHASDHDQSNNMVSGAEEGAGEIGEPSNEDGAFPQDAENANEDKKNGADQVHASDHDQSNSIKDWIKNQMSRTFDYVKSFVSKNKIAMVTGLCAIAAIISAIYLAVTHIVILMVFVC